MAKFYASIKGNRGSATRQGSRKSGVTGHIRGWDFGGRVNIVEENGEEVVYLYLTSGSHATKQDKLIGRYTQKNLEE